MPIRSAGGLARVRRTACALSLLIPMAASAAAPAPTAAAPAPATAAARPAAPATGSLPDLRDPAAAWRDFAAHTSAEQAVEAYQVIYKMHDDDGLKAKCAEQLDALDVAIRKMPVGLALWFTGESCARQSGDKDRAARYSQGVEALVAHALSRDTAGPATRPVMIANANDIDAFSQAIGMDVLYVYQDTGRWPLYHPTVVAFWDATASVERHVAFDFLDTLARLATSESYSGYPARHAVLREAFTNAQSEQNSLIGHDLKALIAYEAAGEGAAHVDLLRSAAADGGVRSLIAWHRACAAKDAPAECGAGLVDALLPLAEKDLALYRVQLALAYARGIGVRKDVPAAMVLLDSAEKRWRGNAIARFAEDWLRLDAGKLPSEVLARLDRASLAGEQRAAVARLRALSDGADFDKPLPKELVAAADALVASNYGPAFTVLSDDRLARKDTPGAIALLRRAADNGDADAMERYASRLLQGEGVPRDRAAGIALMRAAGQAGDSVAMRWMGGYSETQKRWPEAESWYMSSALQGNWRGALDLVQFYQWPESGADDARVRKLYDLWLTAYDRAEFRRAYSAYLSKKPARDAARARALLLQDAEAGDVESQFLLGRGLIEGLYGKPEPDAGMAWVNKSLARSDGAMQSAWAHYLYYKQRTPAARARAFEISRDLVAKDYEPAINNFAWWLCSAEDASLRRPVEGMAIVAKLGDATKLDPGTLDTLAVCEAATGKFADAVAHQALVVDEVEAFPPRMGVERFQRRLALYRQGKPFIEARTDEVLDD
jgi:TPR repeat protein